MCRLLAQISTAKASAEPYLSGSACSLLAQSGMDPKRLQPDGWGVASYDERGRPVVAKSPLAAYDEPERFRQASRAASRIVLAHIRHASNPRGLPRERLLGPENTQPFSHGRFAFAHNGTVELPDRLADRLGPYKERIRGVNDSEVYFYQLVRALETDPAPERAFEACLEELWSLPGAEERRPHQGLNVAVSDGERLIAFCHYPPIGAPGFCSSREWGRMSFLETGDRLVVASESLGPDWRPFEDPEVLTAWVSDGRIRTERRPVRLPARALQG